VAFQVKKTRRVAPVRAIFHGPAGIGKSSLAASAPSPIFVAAEDGLDQIDATAVEPYPTTFEEVLAALDYIATLDHESVAIDSLDWLEPLVWEHTVRKASSSKIKNIEDFGYGKGYIAALDPWRLLIKRLDALRAKGMNIILIAHSVRKMFKNPLGDDYEQWTMKLHEKATGLFVEWAQVVGFCDWDVATEDTSGRVKAQTTGKRIIRTNPNPAFLAKTRFTMPDRLAMPKDHPWDAFAAAVRAGDGAVIASLKGDLEERIKVLGDNDVESKVRAFIKESGETAPVLTDAIERLDITISERRKAS
jgi:AAA domain